MIKRDGRTNFSVMMDKTAVARNSPIHKAVVDAGLAGIAPISSRAQRIPDKVDR